MKIKHLFLALVIGTLAFTSCKKEDPKPQDNNNNRVALAMRSSSGEIVSLVDCEKLTEEMKACRGFEDAFIVESVDVLDKTDEYPYCFRIHLIDVQNERTVSLGYIGDFVEEDDNVFYATRGLENGNYSITDPDGEQFKVKNHVMVDPSEPTEMESVQGFWISCTGDNCRTSTCQTNYFKCTECESTNSEQPAVCFKSGLGWGSMALIGFGTTLISNLIRLMFK